MCRRTALSFIVIHSHDKSCSIGNSSLQIIWTDNPVNKCETVEANCYSASFLSSHSQLHFFFFFMRVSQFKTPVSHQSLEGSLSFSCRSGSPEGWRMCRWMADWWPWRKALYGQMTDCCWWCATEGTVDEGLKDWKGVLGITASIPAGFSER